jgi:hypothetical protein
MEDTTICSPAEEKKRTASMAFASIDSDNESNEKDTQSDDDEHNNKPPPPPESLTALMVEECAAFLERTATMRHIIGFVDATGEGWSGGAFKLACFATTAAAAFATGEKWAAVCTPSFVRE